MKILVKFFVTIYILISKICCNNIDKIQYLTFKLTMKHSTDLNIIKIFAKITYVTVQEKGGGGSINYTHMPSKNQV